MRMLASYLVFSLSALLALTGQGRPLPAGVELEIKAPSLDGSVLHWRITNKRDTAIYVYSFYLWGPAYSVERSGDEININTTPLREEAACPPNRFPPVLLLVVGPGRTIDGDLADSSIGSLVGKKVSMRIAVGQDPYSVVAEAQRFKLSKCKHSPYDAIVQWGKIIASNSLQVSR